MSFQSSGDSNSASHNGPGANGTSASLSRWTLPGVIGAILLGGAAGLWAQDNAGKRPPGKDKDKDKDKVVKISNDPEIRKLQAAFVKDAEILAKKYEKEKDFSKARDVYQEILKIAPAHQQANQRMSEIMQYEMAAKSHKFSISAKDDWQDTGVTAIEDRPLNIRATGKWTLRIEAQIGPEGMPIAKELRDFDPGCLVGMIEGPDKDDNKPFVIGAEKQFIPKVSGKLLMRIFDNDTRDNDGSVDVEVMGMFDSDKLEPPGKKKKTGK